MNPRYPFGIYTISNRARSAGLRDFSKKLIQFSLIIISDEFRKVKMYFHKSLKIIVTPCAFTKEVDTFIIVQTVIL